MKFLNICFFLLLLFVALSCSSKVHKSKSVVYRDASGVQDARKTLGVGEHDDDGSSSSWRETADRADRDGNIHTKYNRQRNDIVIDKDKFTESEKLYPSHSNYDPFGSSSVLVFDLKELKKEFHYPADGHLLSRYGMRSGRMHAGVDIKAHHGDNIYAAFDGVVRISRLFSSYGNLVVIRHYNGLETLYSHNSRNLVKVGDEVSVGDVIAYGGRTGRASGDHVHFEVRVIAQHLNPSLMLDTDNRTLKSGMLYVYKKSGSIVASNHLPTGGGIDSSTDKKESSKDTKDKKVSSNDRTSLFGGVYHTIKSGDTLYSLARKNKTTVSAICKLNGISEHGVLRLGKKLKIK